MLVFGEGWLVANAGIGASKVLLASAPTLALVSCCLVVALCSRLVADCSRIVVVVVVAEADRPKVVLASSPVVGDKTMLVGERRPPLEPSFGFTDDHWASATVLACR